MRSRRLQSWHKLVALAPLLLLVAYMPGEIMVRCHVDGLLRPAPCCVHEQPPVDPGPAWKDANCCDRELTATQRLVSEVPRATHDDFIPIAAVAPGPTPGDFAAPPPVSARPAQRGGPPRGGPPIVLGKHAFLI